MSQYASKPELLVLADDLTGALEAGAAFAGTGIRARVIFEAAAAYSPVTVIDTETRHLAPAAAAERVRQLASGFPGHRLYIKTDSTLRGNIGAELTELSKTARVIYAPAYPLLGRTVRNGKLLVDGVPVEETSFATDELNPVRSGVIELLFDRGGDIDIRDGETGGDVERAALSAISARAILAGPASVAHALAKHIDLPRATPRPLPRVRNALVVSGSRHERSRLQIEAADDDFPWRICTQESSEPIGERVFALATRERFDALIIFGGDTAYSVIRAFGATEVEPMREILPGIPVSRIPISATPGGLFLITKAGGFGPPDVLRKIHAILSRNEE